MLRAAIIDERYTSIMDALCVRGGMTYDECINTLISKTTTLAVQRRTLDINRLDGGRGRNGQGDNGWETDFTRLVPQEVWDEWTAEQRRERIRQRRAAFRRNREGNPTVPDVPPTRTVSTVQTTPSVVSTTPTTVSQLTQPTRQANQVTVRPQDYLAFGEYFHQNGGVCTVNATTRLPPGSYWRDGTIYSVS